MLATICLLKQLLRVVDSFPMRVIPDYIYALSIDFLGNPSTFELEPYPERAKSLATAQHGSNRFGLLYCKGLEPGGLT
jgi:hypothetical protein